MNASSRAHRLFGPFAILLAAALPCAAQNTWRGIGSSIWNVPGNWSDGVPDLGETSGNDPAMIDSIGTPFSTPVVGAGGDASAFGLDVSNNGKLIVEGGGNLTVGVGELSIGTDGSGIVTVTGASSLLRAVGTTDMASFVGDGGTGVLNLADGGRFTTPSLILADNPGSEGTLNIGTGGAAGHLLTGSVVGREGEAVVNFNHTDTVDMGGTDFLATFAGTLSVTKLNTGTLIFSNGANTYTGGTHVSGGVLVISEVGASASVLGTGALDVDENGALAGVGTVLGNASVAGALSPGSSTGKIQFANNLTLESSATIRMELAAPGDYDRIGVTGLLTYDGTLSIDLADGYRPGLNDTFHLFDAKNPAPSTAFGAIVFTVGGYAGEMDYAAGTLVITATGVPEPVVPEPATLGLLVGALVLLGLRRRRQGRGPP